MTTTHAQGLVLPDGTARPQYDEPLPSWVEGLYEHQVDAVREIVDHYKDGVQAVFLDAPVGAGKTLVGDLVRRELRVPRTVYVCSDKALQNQFARDFPDYSRVLKGRANYETLEGGAGKTADDCTSNYPADPCMWCDPKYDCPYQVAKQAALYAPIAVLNTSYLLHVANYTNDFTRNPFVIADEADLLEDALLGFSSYEVPGWIGRELRLKYPKKGVHKKTLIAWLNATAESASDFGGSNRGRLDPKQRRRLSSFIWETRMVAHQLELDASDDDDVETGRWIREYETRTLKLLPVIVSPYGTKNLWRHGRKWLLMSGTIISSDQMADDLGLPLDYATVEVPSPFPVENRRIVLAPVANMTRAATDADYEALVYAIERIVEEHPGRVLVHTVSYHLTKRLVEAVNLGRRPVITYTNAGEKYPALQQYLQTPGAVMFAPSMDRGVDLKGDACECQIITKCPFPSLGDRRISARLKLDDGNTWYAVKTVRDIVQMTGRGVRTMTDVCPTYVLDAQFTRNVWARNKLMFPRYFREAVDERANIRWLMR